MDNDDIAFLVSSCDKYSDLWEPFFTNFFKYWPDFPYKVYLISNHKKYHDERVTTLCVGEDLSYADNLRTALDQIQSKWILLWMDDVIFSADVDTEKVKRIASEAEALNAGYVKLSTDLPIVYDSETDLLIGEIPKGVKYRSAIGLCLIQRKVLLDLAEPGFSAWDMDKSVASDSMPELFCAFTKSAAKNPPFKYIHALIKGKWLYTAVGELKKEGFGELVKSRERQPLTAYLYIVLYLFRSGLYKFFNKYWY